jgi:RNA polymerase sigma-70 factor (ECF subfamily)
MQPFPARRRRIRTEPRRAAQLDYSTLGDTVLVRRAKDGDADALGALCARHEPRVERICRRLLRDREDARDAAQDALARMCVKLPQFRGEAAFSTWLHRLTINTCRDAAARTASRPTVSLETDRRVCAETGPPGRAELGELRDALAAGLATLPASQAQVVVLKDALGLTFEEISERTGMPVGTAKSYAHRARAGLRVALEGEDA